MIGESGEGEEEGLLSFLLLQVPFGFPGSSVFEIGLAESLCDLFGSLGDIPPPLGADFATEVVDGDGAHPASEFLLGDSAKGVELALGEKKGFLDGIGRWHERLEFRGNFLVGDAEQVRSAAVEEGATRFAVSPPGAVEEVRPLLLPVLGRNGSFREMFNSTQVHRSSS